LSKDAHFYEEMVEQAVCFAVAGEFAASRHQIVVIFGIPFGTKGSTNNIRVVSVSDGYRRAAG